MWPLNLIQCIIIDNFIYISQPVRVFSSHFQYLGPKLGIAMGGGGHKSEEMGHVYCTKLIHK